VWRFTYFHLNTRPLRRPLLPDNGGSPSPPARETTHLQYVYAA
jgi:hypothetical protein